MAEQEIKRLKSSLPTEDFAQIRFVAVDLGNEQAVEQLVNDMGRVDILIRPLA